MTRTILDITGTDLQGRGGPRQLRDRLREYLRAERPPVGTPLSTDAELSEHFQLSRSSVRRAMADLQAEGWIDRQVGRGTFVGPRVALDAAESRADIVDPGTTAGTSDQAPGSLSATGSSKRADAGTIRLSVVVFWNADVISNWYTSGILRGLGDVAHDFNVSVELISL
ncbi:MAG: winged helix-turn-helix domain-containing protein, partial [Planctomycetota bacterium]